MRQRKRSPTGYEVASAALLAAAAAELGVRLLSPRPAVPPTDRVDPAAYFSAEEIQRGRRFARPQLGIALGRAAIDVAALVALVRRPPKALGRLRESPLDRRPALAGAIAAGGLAAAGTLPGLPLGAVARWRGIRAGLLTDTWAAWAADLAKATAISAGLSAGAGAVVVGLTRRFPRGWWAPAAGGALVLGPLLAALAPVVLDPIFNDFTPLPEGEIRRDVLALAQAAGVKVGEVFEVDASRRTTAANAYVTGLGPTKRVVLFDTLLERYGRDEVRVVVAHELAHVRHRDVPRGVAYSAIVAPAAAWAVQRLSWAISPERGSAAALPALALAASAVLTPLSLIANRLSRALERRADQVSLELTGAPEAFISFERAITLQNLADPDPPRWVSRLLATHPPTTERIAQALAWRELRPPIPVEVRRTPAGS